MEEIEKNYLIWINNFIVSNNNKEYDFLEEMHPDIKKLYNMRDEIRKQTSGAFTKEDMEFRKQLENNIKIKLSENNLPEYVLIKEQNEELIEVLSGENLRIINDILKLRQIENKELIDEYINSLTIGIVDSLNEEIPKFKKKIKVK